MGSRISIRTVMFSILLTIFSAAKDKIPRKDHDIAKRIAKEKGVLKPTEVQKWNPPKEIPKDWVKLDNDFFTVYYPKCFSIDAAGEDGDIKTTPLVTIKRSEKCPSFIKDYGDYNWFVFAYRWDLRSIKSSSNADHLVFTQNIIVNKFEGKIFAGILGVYETSEDIYKVQLRWQVLINCKNKIFEFSTEVPSGNSSLNLIHKNEYSIPDDFKQILSTFDCNDRKLEVK